MEGLLGQGLELMIYGMGTVVVFLTLLVFATRFMSFVVARFLPEPIVADDAPAGTGEARSGHPASPSPAQLAAITAAIHRFRDSRL